MKKTFTTIGNVILSLLFLPLLLCFDIFLSNRSVGKKMVYLIVLFPLVGLIWIGTLSKISESSNYFLKTEKVIDKPIKVPVSGTSMLPTIKDNSIVEVVSAKGYQLKRGDIISFNNPETLGLNYMKRVLGLPGEEISIKNGYVFINNIALSEEYIYRHAPTYGNTFLADCEKVKVPDNQYFVMGDNRTVSADSRILGFIERDDIDQVIKTDYKEKYLTEQKQNQVTSIKLDPKVFLKKLNEKRQQENTSDLVTHNLLNDLAAKRATQIKENFDNWKNKSFPLNKTLDQNNYHYNLIDEYVTFGYYNEDDIINQIMESPRHKDKFLSSNFTEVGIGITERQYQECTYPVISVILSWPSSPTYDQTQINDMLEDITLTKQWIDTAQLWVGNSGKDQNKLRKFITLLSERSDTYSRIVKKMQNKEWLTQKDNDDLAAEAKNLKEIESLAGQLFPRVQGAWTVAE